MGKERYANAYWREKGGGRTKKEAGEGRREKGDGRKETGKDGFRF